MAYRKRSRSHAQKVHRKFNERLSTLRSKIEELNAIKENRAVMMWTDKDKTLGCGDEQLLKSLGYTVRVHSNRVRRPTLSPANSASSAASLDRHSQYGQKIFEDGEVFGLGSLQEKQPPVSSAKGNGLKLKWRKEDLDLLAFDFFSDDY
ncbi:hypothetical protein F4824DRAFT_70115 [Ustulina deusta]|nr:hypothetical protein F4824DRAFT_302860 [Ustulina deusta]KAI3339056.1 hypothetical protein F4824DRAFT_70115 [Ustulina deusta]